MNTEQTIRALLNGGKIRGSKFPNGAFITLKNGHMVDQSGNECPICIGLKSGPGWQIYLETITNSNRGENERND